MGIRMKHLDDYYVDYNVLGNNSAAVKRTFRAPFAGKIIAVGQAVKTAGVTGSQIADALINTVSVFTTAGNKPTLTTGVEHEVKGAALIDGPATFAKGDLITLSLTAVHSGTVSVDLSLWCVLRQQRGRGITEYPE